MSHSKHALRFENLFLRLLARESVDLYAEELSPMFEVLATNGDTHLGGDDDSISPTHFGFVERFVGAFEHRPEK